jgi:hypothetical protein
MCAEKSSAKVSKNHHQLAGSERPRPSSHKLIGPADAAELIGITLVVRPRPGSPALPDLEHWQATPLSKRRYLTPEEYARRHGAADEDLAAAAAFAKSKGLRVTESHAGRRTVSVQGTAAQLNAAFGVTLNHYEAPVLSLGHARKSGSPATEAAPVKTHVYHGYDGQVTLPSELAGVVHAVIGLDNRRRSVAAGGTGDPAGAAYNPVPTVAGYYNFPIAKAADQTIGVHAPGGAAYQHPDIATYFSNITDANYQTPPSTLNDISLTVGVTTYSNDQASVSYSNNFDLELTQDISTSATIAQGATMNVYFTEDSEQGWLVFLNRVLLPESEPQPTAITSSFPLTLDDSSGSIGSLSDTSSIAYQLSTLFQSLAALGIECFTGLGDWGSDDGIPDGNKRVSYPGSDPWITSCGGTVLAVNPGPPQTLTEWAWSDAHSNSQFAIGPSSNFGATGGGVSATFPTPPYQAAAGITGATDSDGTIATGRGVPDLAAMVGYSGFYCTGISYSYAGTSCVAPLNAGLSAVMRSVFGRSLGPYNTLLYQLGNVAFNDVTYGNNDSVDTPDAPYFTAGAGWDACTGWGSIDGTKLLNGIAALLYNPNYYFQVNKGSYGLDEVRTTPSYSNDPLWLVLEGFSPNAVMTAGLTPTVSADQPGVTVSVGSAQFEIASQPNTPQRVLFPCIVTFASSAIAPVTTPPGIFPAPGSASPAPVNLTSNITMNGQPLSAYTQLELEAGDDPYFANFDPAGSNPFWLSQDLRVFTLTPGAGNNSVAGETPLNPSNPYNWDSAAGYTYIQGLLSHLNSAYSNSLGTDPFTLFPDQSNALSGDSSVTPTTVNPADPTGTPLANYNFAVARVRLSGTAGLSGANVRVLFRIFAAETGDTDYQSSTYPATNDSAGQPLNPQLGTGNVTIPFFATGNYEANSDYQENVDYWANGQEVNSINNQQVNIPSSGSVWAYYGCYLNIYPPANTITVSGHPVAVQSLLPSSHSCVVAQLAYDDAPMPTGPGVLQGPEYSSNFAQRNLQITSSDNPGPAETHRVPQTFDVRPSKALGTGELLDYPDELMLEWGKVPVGSTANIYWPQVKASDVLSLAGKLYSTHQLSAADAYTVQCTVPRGFTFVPIPPGTGENYAGLFTVQLPQGVKAGEEFTITVRRVSSRRVDKAPQQPQPEQPQLKIAAEAADVAPGKRTRNWRYIVGSFAVRIPVTTPKVMLPAEDNTLAIMKWRLEQISPVNRWHPVLKRYISYIEARVNGLGGHAATIKPSPWGSFGPPKLIPLPDHHHPCHGEWEREITGKVAGLIYDHFGDFEGFILETAACETHRICSREEKVEILVRELWQDRSLVTVIVKGKDSCCLIAIIAGSVGRCCEEK